MLHRVNKLQFETRCTTDAQAFGVRHKFAHTYQEQITQVIDKVCSMYVSEDEWIQIDRIEVDLESFSLQAFEENFTNMFLEKFEKELSKKMQAIPAAEKIPSRQISYLKLLVYFLQNGTLPWWAGEEDVNMSVALREVAEHNRISLRAFLDQQCFTEVIWKRISMQFNGEGHKLILSLFLVLSGFEKKLIRWLNLFAGEKEPNTNNEVVNSLVAERIRKFVLMHAPALFKSAKENILESYFIRHFAQEFIPLVQRPVSVEKGVERILEYEKNAVQIKQAEVMATGENEKEEIPAVLAKAEEMQAEKFTVHTAGVVLLAPYFKQLFTHLNLLEQGEWKNREAHYKAIHLVRYLATGEEMCPEHSLVMEKLLCGIEINAPIPREVELSEEDKTETGELLKSVIANWPKLKNTSVAGLREAFLKRDGILTKKENGWLLQVERKTQDVLLESISWGFSTLTFSWTGYAIFTEW